MALGGFSDHSEPHLLLLEPWVACTQEALQVPGSAYLNFSPWDKIHPCNHRCLNAIFRHFYASVTSAWHWRHHMVKQGGGEFLGFPSQHKKPTVTQLNPPQSIFLVYFTQTLFFNMCSIQLIYLICDRNLFLDKKTLQNSAKFSTTKICLFWEYNKLSLSQGHPIQTSSFPTRFSQTDLSRWLESWTFQVHFIGETCHFNASDMAVFCPVQKQHPVSGTHRQISKVHSPDFCLWYF